MEIIVRTSYGRIRGSVGVAYTRRDVACNAAARRAVAAACSSNSPSICAVWSLTTQSRVLRAHAPAQPSGGDGRAGSAQPGQRRESRNPRCDGQLRVAAFGRSDERQPTASSATMVRDELFGLGALIEDRSPAMTRRCRSCRAFACNWSTNQAPLGPAPCGGDHREPFLAWCIGCRLRSRRRPNLRRRTIA